MLCFAADFIFVWLKHSNEQVLIKTYFYTVFHWSEASIQRHDISRKKAPLQYIRRTKYPFNLQLKLRFRVSAKPFVFE